MENNRQYNLRSSKHASVTIPVEIQMCTDTEFLNTLLNTKQSVNTVDSVSDISSLSELDCSALIDMSDSVDNKMSDEDNSMGAGSQQAGSSGSDGYSVQMLVNQQILAKLEQLRNRIDKLENTRCKKTSDSRLIKNSKKTKTSSPKTKSSKSVAMAASNSETHPPTTCKGQSCHTSL